MDDRNKQKRELINKLTDQENHVKSIFHFLSIWNTIDITWNGCLCPATEAEVQKLWTWSGDFTFCIRHISPFLQDLP